LNSIYVCKRFFSATLVFDFQLSDILNAFISFLQVSQEISKMSSATDTRCKVVKNITTALDGLSLDRSGTDFKVGQEVPDSNNGDVSKPIISKTKCRRSRKKNKVSNNNNDNDERNGDKKGNGEMAGADLSEVSRKNGPFKYSGNNIILVSNDGYEGSPESIPPSCIDNTLIGDSRRSAGEDREGTSILGIDLESAYDEDDSTQRAASWCLANQTYTDGTDFSPVSIPTVGGDHRYSYLAASAFQIGPTDSSNSVSTHRYTNNGLKSPDSGSNASCNSTVPAFAYCATFLDDFTNCQAPNCSSLANIKCAQCLSAFYCNEDHQKVAWPQHREVCTSYRVEGVGIGAADGLPVSAAVACRNIPEGQVIFEEKAMLVFPLADSGSENLFDHPMDLSCVKSRMENSSGSVSCKANKPACLGCMRVVEFIGPPRYQCCKCGLPICSYNCQFLNAHLAGECNAVSSQKYTVSEDVIVWLEMRK